MSRTGQILAGLLCSMLADSVGLAQLTDTQAKAAYNEVAAYQYLPVANNQRSLSNPEVILTREMSPKQLSELTKDLQTLNHLVRKAIGQSSPRRSALGVSVQSGKGSSIRYTQGAGVVLTYHVNAVLWVANENQAEAVPEKPKKPESEWDQASRQLHNPQQAAKLPTMLLPGDFNVNVAYSVTTAKFNTSYVGELEQKIRKALKNVGRVRHLKAGDRPEPVIVVLKGLSGSSMMTFTTDASRWEGTAADAVSVYRYGSTPSAWNTVYNRYLWDVQRGSEAATGKAKKTSGGR